MCGIVGIAGNMNLHHREAFEDMLRVCQVRGRDSTGVFKVGFGDKVSWAKRVGPPDYLLDTGAYDRTIVQGGFPTILVGHCRAKTFGGVSEDNAHPFDFPNLIGVHNGTLRGTHKLEYDRDYEVDSQVLYRNINDRGIDEVIPELDNDGAWALVYWDKVAKTLNFIRNDKRPLWFTHTKDLKVMAWASEPWMFSMLTRRTGIDLWDGGDAKQTYYQLPVDQLYSFSVDGTGKDGPSVFTFANKELKGEVRGYTGNVTGASLGTSGANTGGSVVRPFPNQREVARIAAETVRRINAGEELDDEIPTFGLPTPKTLQLPNLKPTPTGGGSGTSNTTGNKSSSTSTTSSGSSTEAKPSTRSARETLSLPRMNSDNSPQGSNVVSINTLGDSSSGLKRPRPVSHRSVLGMTYITDNNTGIEFEEKEFDKETGGICCYCKQPIGDLLEVNTIFVSKKSRSTRQVTFTCNSCQYPAVA